MSEADLKFLFNWFSCLLCFTVHQNLRGKKTQARFRNFTQLSPYWNNNAVARIGHPVRATS